MVTLLFWDIDHGTLERLPFLKNFLIICISLCCFFIPIVVFQPLSLHSPKITSVAMMINTALKLWGITVYATVVFPPLILALFNLIAKRIRNMGFPGWWSQLISVVLLVLSTKIHLLLTECYTLVFILFLFLGPRNVSENFL